MRNGDADEPRRREKKSDKLLTEEQREDTETFGQRHTDDGLDENFARGSGIAADSFSGLLTDETDADGGAKETERGGDTACDFSEDCHVGGCVVLLDFRRAHTWHAPDGRGFMR